MFERFKNWIKGVAGRMLATGNSYRHNDLPPSLVDNEMSAAIERWKHLYYNEVPWRDKSKLSLGLAAIIANKIATMVTIEAKITVTDHDGDAADDQVGDAKLGDRAKLINEALQDAREQLPVQTEYACALGGLMFKPYTDGVNIRIDYIKAYDFYPTRIDARGKIVGAVFFEAKTIDDKHYTRVEEHNYDAGTRECLIRNRVFQSYENNGGLGNEISLTSVPDWAHLEPEVVVKNLDAPLFSYFKIPQGNVENMNSELGVSVYARADKDGLIEEADRQLQRYMWEFEGGQMAVHASRDAFRQEEGNPKLPEGRERLFMLNDLDTASDAKEGLFSTFAPVLRDASYSSGLNDVLIKVENACSLARGTLADVESEARTATEIKTTKQSTYQLVSSIQHSLGKALDGLVAAVDAMATLYNLAPAGEYHVSYVWDDSVIVDAEAERMRDMQEVREGLMQKWEYRKKWYGESEAKAKSMVQGNNSLTDDELMGFANNIVPPERKENK